MAFSSSYMWMAELRCFSLFLPPTASRDPWTVTAVEYLSGVSVRVRHCAGGLPVCVRAGRDMLSMLLPSLPPSRYSVSCIMVYDIRQPVSGSGVVINHWWVDVLRTSTVFKLPLS